MAKRSKRSLAASKAWRARKAKERARSLAASKGWDTRRKNQSNEWTKKSIQAQIEKARQEGIEIGRRAQRKEIYEHLLDASFRIETPEERQKRMSQMMREAEALTGRWKYFDMLKWIQRNGFVTKEFFREYDKRKGRAR